MFACVFNTWPTGQDVQVVAVPEHVAQLALHDVHDVPDVYVPFGHAEMHDVSFRDGNKYPLAHDVQLVAVPVQFKQFPLHGRHDVPDVYVPFGHAAMHDVTKRATATTVNEGTLIVGIRAQRSTCAVLLSAV